MDIFICQKSIKKAYKFYRSGEKKYVKFILVGEKCKKMKSYLIKKRVEKNSIIKDFYLKDILHKLKKGLFFTNTFIMDYTFIFFLKEYDEDVMKIIQKFEKYGVTICN
jgi:hypothetical protein